MEVLLLFGVLFFASVPTDADYERESAELKRLFRVSLSAIQLTYKPIPKVSFFSERSINITPWLISQRLF